VERTLSEDDVAGARAIYRSGSDPGNGILTGTVTTEQGSPILGAHVVAVDGSGVVRVSALTNRYGGFVISSLPPGSYQLYVEPLDGPMDPTSVYSDEHRAARHDFRTTFAGGNASPTALTVTAGTRTTVAPIRVPTQPPTLNVSTFRWSRDWRKWNQNAAAPIRQGERIYLAVYGPRMDKVPTRSFRMSSSDLVLVGNEVARGGPPEYDPPYAVLPFTAHSGAVPGPRTLFVNTGSELVAYSGVLEVVPR
jgi:hypothetical protein